MANKLPPKDPVATLEDEVETLKKELREAKRLINQLTGSVRQLQANAVRTNRKAFGTAAAVEQLTTITTTLRETMRRQRHV